MERSALSGPGYVRVPSPGPYRTSSILDSRGNPYRLPRDPLSAEGKARASEVFRDLPISPLEIDWTPTEMRGALAEHVLGLFARSALLMDAIIGDDRVQSALGSRIGALLGLDELVEASAYDAGDECAHAWAEAWPKCHAPIDQGDVLETVRRDDLMAGLHVSELVWDTTVEPWQPYLKPWHLQHVYFDLARRCLIALTEDGPVEIVPGDGRWFVHTSGGIYRGYLNGLVRALSLPWLLRNLARRDWARYSERHGMPLIKASVPAVANAEDKKRFETDLVTMGTEAVVVLPQGMDGEGFDVDLLEAASQSWEGFDRLIIRCDAAITLAVQWQNLTTEVKEGSHAAARVHADVKQSAVERDDRALARDIQMQIARPFALWNFGDARRAPRTRRDVEVLEDQASKLDCLEKFGRAVAALRQAGESVDVPALAKAYRIKLPIAKAVADGEPIFGYHLAARIVKRDEARKRLGLTPIGGELGEELLGADPNAKEPAP